VIVDRCRHGWRGFRTSLVRSAPDHERASTDNDVDTSARVAVIGSTVTEDLFGETYPVGKSVKINGVSYEVVGVLKEQGQGFGGNPDTTVYIPISTAQSRLYPDRTRTGAKAVSTIYAEAASEDLAEEGVDQITDTLRNLHGITYSGEDDFSIFSQTDLLETIGTITGILTAFLGAIAGISLVVGGIGIMNIMLVSVTERTREIGIRKAIGALKRDILVQFLLESSLLSVLGGLIGIVLGWAIAKVSENFLDFSAVVDAKQREAIYALQAKYQADIKKLEQQLAELKGQLAKEVDAVLTPEQLTAVKKKREEAASKKKGGIK